jgi:hypothetical protein
MTDEMFNELLVTELKKVAAFVREGVYTGDDVPVYITFSYYVRGTNHANDRPSAKTWRVIVTLWAKKGVPVYAERTKMKEVIELFSGSYPSVETATDDGWQQYIFEFEYAGGVEQWQKS